MKFTNPFSSRRPTEKLNVPVVTFLGEQDGPPERVLKSKLSELFAERKNVRTAYLAKAHYGDPLAVSVCLCLGVTGGADESLVEAVHSLFARNFNRAVHLDTMFLRAKEEEEVALVCKPFYQLS